MSDKVLMGHGSGGQMMHRLVHEVLAPAFSMKNLADAAIVDMPEEGRVALTTDSYVVSPIFFPGGNIGDLAVCGTVNDLAVIGARPLYLTVGLILEEGLPMESLRQVVAAMAEAAKNAGVSIVAGDTKVVERGSCDGMYINTAGVGTIPFHTDLSAATICDGDVVVVSGPCGTHGMAIMAERNKLSFNPPLESDTAALHDLIGSMLAAAPSIRMMRDPTRGGLATTLKEIAQESAKRIVIGEDAIPVLPRVKGACDLLGLDPLYVANEGVVVAVVDPSQSQALLDAMRSHPLGKGAAEIGHISGESDRKVLLETSAGGSRILEMLVGEQLPRIC